MSTKNLFTKLNLEEIKKKQDENRQKIENKKEELRNLVLTRYRDLIDSADSIVQMKKVSEEFILSLGEAQNMFKSFYKLPSVSETKIDESQKNAIQIENLQDTPEKIWSALDDSDSYQATFFYFKAKHIYSSILDSLKEKIPSIKRTWSSIEQFPKQIIDHSISFLSTKKKIPSRKCASVLCSILILEKNGNNAFQKFLNYRIQASENILKKGVDQLEDLASIIQSNFQHAEQIFKENNSKQPLLLQYLSQMKKEYSNIPNIEFLFNSKNLQKEMQSFISQIKKLIISKGSLLMRQISSGQEIKKIKDKVIYAIQNPYFFEGQSLEEKVILWDDLSNSVYGEPLDLWETIFREVIETQERIIIKASFSSIHLDLDLKTLKKSNFKNISQNLWNQNENNIKKIQIKSDFTPPFVESIANNLDKQLKDRVDDLNYLLNSDQSTKNIIDLKEYIQVVCYETLENLVKTDLTNLKDSLTREFKNQLLSSKNTKTLLSPLGFNKTHFPTKASENLDSLITLGRIPRNLIQNSSQLSQILNGTTFLNNKNKKTTVEVIETELYLKSKTLLNVISFSCSSIWISWIFSEFYFHLSNSVNEEDWNDNFRKTKWILKEEEERGSFLIPLQPSSYLYSLLFSISKEMNSIGFDFSNNPIICSTLIFTLFQAVYSIYSKLLLNKEIVFNQEGLIQIFFDIKFLTLILCSRNPQLELEDQIDLLKEIQSHFNSLGISNFSFSTEVKVTSWLSKQKELIENVENRFDPIELQFYKKTLLDASQKSYEQSVVLFGSLVLGKTPKSNSLSSFSLNPNILTLVPTPQKLLTLPVSNLEPLPLKTTTVLKKVTKTQISSNSITKTPIQKKDSTSLFDTMGKFFGNDNFWN